MKNVNILIVGVGGQGTLLASRVLGALASIEGKDCKLSEVHGMSQRGGSVVTHVRIGDNVLSPVITEGEADYILAFEKLEALRWCHYLRKDGTILINDQEIMPMPVITGNAEYPQGIYEVLDGLGKRYVKIDGLGLSGKAGSTKAVNVVMIGALTRLIGVSEESGLQAVERCVPQKLLEINRKAYNFGYLNTEEA